MKEMAFTDVATSKCTHTATKNLVFSLTGSILPTYEEAEHNITY
jgi:hypothetical protein